LADDVRPLFHLPQQQTPSIAGDGSAVELPRGFLVDLGDEMETVLGYTL
jgi:hypothetical protein